MDNEKKKLIKERIAPSDAEVWVPGQCAYIGDLVFEAYTEIRTGQNRAVEFEMNGVKVRVTKVG